MGVLVRVPIPFRSCAGDQTEVMVEGNTVQKVLENLNESHGGIMERLCDEKGNLRGFVNLYLNDREIRSLANLDTKVRDGDKISIIPAIAGG